MNTKLKLISVMVGLSLGQGAAQAATDMEMLMKILQKKGVVTSQEAQEILQETQDALDTQKSEQTALKEHVTASEEAVATLNKIKFKGDLRVREDVQSYDVTAAPDKADRNRQRYRARFGFTYDVSDQTELGLTLASGETDVGSTNQTFENSFDPKAIFLDKAYVHQKFMDGGVEFLAGKFENPFQPSTWLVYDSDVRFEGFAGRVNGDMGNSKLHASGGFFPLDEASGSTADPFLGVAQVGALTAINDDTALDTKLAFYHFEDVNAIDGTGKTRTGNTATLANGIEYEVMNLTAELALKKLLPIPAKLVGDYIHNTAAEDLNNGWLIGLDLGKKPKEFGDLMGFLTYSHLEADATYDQFTDSDFHSGGTNNEGWTLGYVYGLGKGWNHELKYYNTQEESDLAHDGQNDEQRLQVDMNYKF